MSVTEEFWQLVMSAESTWETTDGTDELEPYLLAVLEFVKKNIDHRTELVECFKILVNEDRGPIEVLEFCMRELRWKEVQEAVIQTMKENTDIRVLDALNRILAVYEDEWEDGNLYKYYS